MADISKAEWQKLLDEQRGVSDQLRDVVHQLKALTDRADRAEKFQEKVEPNVWFVTFARWIVGAFAVTLGVGIISFAFWLGSLSSDVRHHTEALEKVGGKLDTATDRLAKAEASLQVIMERTRPHPTSALVYEGRVAKVVGRKLSLRGTGAAKGPVIDLAPNVTVSLEGRKARPEDLKPGMLVRAIIGDKGEATHVETFNATRRPEPIPAPPG
jgi:hypothetical protein